MEKIRINNFKESVYYEKLENGLLVYLVPLKNKNSYFTMYGVKYGGKDTKFKVDGKLIKTPSGIAHFLEHKLFDRDDDPFTFYQESGTDVNAFTSSDFTNYYIQGNKNYKKNLKYLLNWIQSLNITDDLVKKEQGIILEEASMYKDIPARIINDKVNENTFVKELIRNKTIGTDNDIISITKEELELCYNTFYTPDNMFVISVGNFNPKEAMDIIKENVIKNKTDKNILKYYEDEPDCVYKEFEEIETNIDITRVACSYKFNRNIFDNLNIDDFSIDLYIDILIIMGLGGASDIREKWLNDKLFIGSTFKILKTHSHYIIEFYATSNKADQLIDELDNYLQDIKISFDDFEREKKLCIAGEVKVISSVSNVAYGILDDILNYGKFIPDKVKYIRNLNYDDFIKIKKLMKFNTKSVVKLVPKDK